MTNPLIFAYPHTYVPPIDGDYTTLDEEYGAGWKNTFIVSPLQNPAAFYEDFIQQNIPHAPVVPMTEEAVLASAYINTQLGLPGLKLTPALNCVCRARQRAIIHNINPELNPKWVRADRLWSACKWKTCVVKAGASTLGHGVRRIVNTSSIRLTIQEAERAAYYELARAERVIGQRPMAVIEEYIEGEQFEISGVVDSEGRITHWFNVLHQTWDKGRIFQYERTHGSKQEELQELVTPVVKGFGLTTCGFNVEIRGNKIIEIQPRLGEELGEYESLLSPDISSAQMVYNVLS